jgi:hypothetical protein
MKFFPQVLIALSAVLSVASAADLESQSAVASSPSTTNVVTVAEPQTRRLEDEPWENGTMVYNEFPNEGWWSGTITSFNQATGMYTVTWEDGSTDYYDDGDKIDQMVANAQNDPQNNPAGASSVSGAYPAGTTVSFFEEGQWWDGVVVQYGSGTYTIKWDDDGEIETVQAGPIMDQMVQDAFGDDDAPPEGYEAGNEAPTTGIYVGAAVSYYEDGEWSDGEIIQYTDGVYTVRWDDGSTDEYDDFGDDLDELQQAVLDSFGDDDAPPVASENVSGPKFPNGTPVSDWEDGEWVDGVVVNFQAGSYVVQWEDEDEYEYYDSHDAEDMQELKKMAADGNGDDDAPPASFFENNDLWEIGTPVAVHEDGEMWYGKIDGFKQGEYFIAWDDGETEYLDNFDLVNQMVSNAALNPKKKGMSAVGAVFLSLFLISVAAVGGVYGYKYYENYQDKQKRVQETELEADGEGFRDQPDDLPKII